MSRRHRLCAVTLLVASLCGCHAGEPTTETEQPLQLPAGTSVFLISVDTLRADRLPLYGYRAGSTPSIDALAAEAVTFERAYSHTPLTLPSHATVLSGRLPMDHGIHDNLGFTLADSVATLPTLLRSAGYRTAAAVSSYALPAKSGLGRGFDLYEGDFQWEAGSGLGAVQRPGEETLELLRPWLRSEASSTDRTPLFALLHLYEPHSPYRPASDLAARFEDPYDGEIATADRVIGSFLDELRSLKLYDDSLIILFSDHGEGLGDHGEEEHGLLLYPETLHVPLLIKLPKNALGGTRRSDPVGLADMLPTLAALLGFEPPADLPGRSLFADHSVPRPIVSETLYPRLHFGWSELVSVVDGDLFYIHGPDPELFDLASDPGARHNLGDTQRRSLRELREVALSYGLDPNPSMTTGGSSEDVAALAALGYVSGTAPNAPDERLDPKTRVHTLGDLTEGFRLFHDGKYTEAATTLTRAIESNPRLVHAWEYLARSFHNAGELESALDAYFQAISLTTGSTGRASVQNAAPAAMILLRLGRVNEALRLVEDQLSREPNERRLLDLEIRTLLMGSETGPALDKARNLAERNPLDPAALYQLAVALALQGDLGEAKETLRRVLELAPDHPAALADLNRLEG